MPRSKKAAKPLFEDRVRFNGGYHDGAQAQERGWTPEWQKGKHFDPVYERAYWAGREDKRTGVYDGNSSAAWVRDGGKPDPWFKAA